jgi:hypothetical protein
LEVRRCGDGHPPVTERERVIRLNGIGGVTFQNPDRIFDPGFLLGRRSERCNAWHESRQHFLLHMTII